MIWNKKVLFSVCLVWLVVGVELKETLCGSVDAIVHEASDSRDKAASWFSTDGVQWNHCISNVVCNKRPSSVVKIGSIVQGIADL